MTRFFSAESSVFWTNNSLIYGTYRLLTRIIFALTFPVFLIYSGLTGKHRTGLRQRLGLYKDNEIPKSGAPVIWIHGASVGEVMAAGILTIRIKNEFPDTDLILSTVTEQGLEIAEKQFGNKAHCLIAPLDIPGVISRAVDAISPDLYICLETELWPNLLHDLKMKGIRLFLLNGRLSERSYRRYKFFKGFVCRILDGFEKISAISGKDAERFTGLGISSAKVRVTGNIKYDLPETEAPDQTRSSWRHLIGLREDQPLLVAGSTHTGEEKMMLAVLKQLKKELKDLVLIIAPRHLRRIDELRREFDNAGINFELLSSIKNENRRSDIIVVDTIGDLAEIYSAADFIFCGGSLVSRGGHNIIEAAIWGVPVFYGPSMSDFNDARLLLEGHGGIPVKDQSELVDKIRELFRNKQLYNETSAAARSTARSQQGAADRQLAPVFDAIRTICSNNDAII